MSWLERIFRRRHLYDELGEEVREHIEEKTEQLMPLENLSRTEARQAALRAFGNPALAIGLGAAAAIAQLMRTLLFGVSPLDPLSFAVVPLILVLAAALASFLPLAPPRSIPWMR
jgi:hypothetical protein